jgi:NAD(P)-dependent dehydrogenase (short-subunit alcohol dehydrogenase family)
LYLIKHGSSTGYRIHIGDPEDAMGSAVVRLSGKVAIITGASTGTGPVMARLFVQEGARVLLAARESFDARARELLGEDHLLTTRGIIVLCIRQGLLSVERADEMKAVLESRRFRMTFKSFRDVL